MKIFIDQGHNPRGTDTGAAYNGLKEQDVTFTIGKLLADRLRRIGILLKHCLRHTQIFVFSFYCHATDGGLILLYPLQMTAIRTQMTTERHW